MQYTSLFLIHCTGFRPLCFIYFCNTIYKNNLARAKYNKCIIAAQSPFYTFLTSNPFSCSGIKALFLWHLEFDFVLFHFILRFWNHTFTCNYIRITFDINVFLKNDRHKHLSNKLRNILNCNIP